MAEREQNLTEQERKFKFDLLKNHNLAVWDFESQRNHESKKPKSFGETRN